MANLDKKVVWHDVLETIRISVSSAIFSTWFSQTHLVDIQENDKRINVTVGCGSPFIKSTIESRYFGLVQDSLASYLGKPVGLIFSVKQDPSKLSSKPVLETPLFGQEGGLNEDFLSKLKQAKIRQGFTFQNYAVSSSNQMAWAAAEAVSGSPGKAYNPLFIWGGVGVGKTHLMNAIAYAVLAKDSGSKILFCTGEDFTNDIVEGIRNKTTPVFRNRYRKLNVLLIDDIQFIAGKDAVQEEFFHTFNTVTAAGGQVILTSDKPPFEISRLEERLRSRFEAGLIVDITPPDFELRCAIVQIKTREKGIDLDMGLVQLIAGNSDSARKIEGFLVRLVSESKLKKVGVNEEIILSLLGKKDKEVVPKIKATPAEIISAVAKHYSVGKRALLGVSRARPIALPRQVLMYILRTQLSLPLEEVGRLIGGRDHTTVMHAVDKITHLVSTDVQIREDLLGIKSGL